MVQVINRAPSFGGNLGNAFGTGLGTGLQSLAENKLKQAQQSQWSNVVNQILGGSSQQEGSQSLQVPPGLNEKTVLPLAQLAFKKQSEDRKASEFEHKQDVATQEKLEPFLRGQSEDYNNAKKIYTKAKSMLGILKKNKEKWPTVTGYLPEVLQRDPEVRKYIADANNLVTLLSGSRKGIPTNFKIKLEQLSKPSLTQPYETQVGLLEDLLKDADRVFLTQKKISDLKKQHGGKLPRDVRQQLIEEGLESSEEEESDMTKYAGDNVQDDQGKLYKWDVSEKRYRPAKKKV